MIATLLALSLAVAVDSVSHETAGAGVISPAGRIAHEAIEECSGIVWHNGAFYTHNDSGGAPVVFRSRHPGFPEEDTEVLPVPEAEARDWEDITILDGDLILGDIGDNFRQRSNLTLYRARYVAADGRMELVATYLFQYPDGRHDAEALAVIDGKIHLITKAREEAVTNLYVFDSLRDGEMNVPRFAGSLEIGESGMVTAADYDPKTETLLLMTYTHLLQYSKSQIAGHPVRSTLIAARQNEALCFREEEIIFTNEQRDVFAVDRFFSRSFNTLLPERGKAILPTCAGPHEIDGSGRSWREQSELIPLANAREGETIRWCLAEDHLLVQGHLTYDEEIRSTGRRLTDLQQLGPAVLMVFAHNPHWELTGEEIHIAVDLSEPSVRRLDLTANPMGIAPLQKAEIVTDARDGFFTFELALPLSTGLVELIGDRFLFDLHGLELSGSDEVRFSGIDLFTVSRPYIWGEVTLQKP